MIKKIFNWQVFLGLTLIVLSAIVYFVHYLLFHDVHHIVIYLVGDIAFVFIEVLMVVLIIHKVLEHREKRVMLKKLNMVIGIFFAEVGTELIRLFAGFDTRSGKIKEKMVVKANWTDTDFLKITKALKLYECKIDCSVGGITDLKIFLAGKKEFLLSLLENPNLLEHQSFTDLLWAVFHLTEELMCRSDVTSLSDPDRNHLAGDIKRAYCHLITAWLNYMKHLKSDYPYLFSLAMRTNPFDAEAKVEVA